MEQNFNLIYQTCFENNSYSKLQNFCTELIFKEPGKIFNSIDFISLSEKHFISLIQHDNFQKNVIQVWEQVLKWGTAQNPELPSDPSSYSKDDFNTLRNTLQQLIPFIKFFNLSHKEFVDKVYPYKKLLPKDLRENLTRHFINQSNNTGTNTTNKIDSMGKFKNLSIGKDYNIMVNEINDFIYKSVNEVLGYRLVRQKVTKCFSDNDIKAQEIYNWLLKNQISPNSIFLLGYFNFHGIVTSLNVEKAFNLFIDASEKNHTLAQFFVGKCYKYGYGTIKNEELTFKYHEKAANKNYTMAQLEIGYSYRDGIGIKKDFTKAFYWYEKAAKNGSIQALFNLGDCYKNGNGVKKNYNKAFELYKQSAVRGDPDGIRMLGFCYNNGIGTKIDKLKAFKLYQNAANLGDETAQYNLALMYEKGDGIMKDMDKAIYWYNKSANKGYEEARNNLERFQINNL
ncbi:kinase-like domain-containing protein [Rhizophagus clarus]|uniref:Kinase-like domain-containing protein n=1 Tax=Rhizophagus clarus TaxID=94130 RepID=A0A8H3R808_9GLOM|nr:kinase-like domain-containing protein [Rhizophagus clarus]